MKKKLTDTMRAEIIAKYGDGKQVTQKQLADQYNVSQPLISRIIREEKRKLVTNDAVVTVIESNTEPPLGEEDKVEMVLEVPILARTPGFSE